MNPELSTLQVLIADDELLARRRLRRLLGELDDVEVAGECCDGVEVLARLQQGGVDVLLLDIHMPRLDGLEVLRLLARTPPVVVLVTAHAQHAVEAFEQDAVDYLLKPVEGERLEIALQRARRRLAPPAAAPVCPMPEPSGAAGEADGRPTLPGAAVLPDRLAISTRKGLVLLDPATVTHALLEGATCQVHTAGGESFVTDFHLSDLERRLPPGSRFERLHRKALVNLEQIERLEPLETGGYLAHLRTGQQVEVSRQAARRLRRLWNLPR